MRSGPRAAAPCWRSRFTSTRCPSRGEGRPRSPSPGDAWVRKHHPRRVIPRGARPGLLMADTPALGEAGRRSGMDYNDVIVRIGEVVDAAGVAVIVLGAVISVGAAAFRLG